MSRRATIAALACAAALAGGCGGSGGPPDKLSREDALKVVQARERLDDAIDTEETLRTSRPLGRALVRRVRVIAGTGSLEDGARDEFSRRALARVQNLVPSLVLVDAAGRPRRLDTPAVEAFLARAGRDAPGALLRPARREVDAIDGLLDDADAGPATRIPGSGERTAERFLRSAERDVKPIWPDLARRLARTRAKLD